MLGGSPNITVSTFLHLNSYPTTTTTTTTTTNPPLARSGSDKGVYNLTLNLTPSKKRFEQLLV